MIPWLRRVAAPRFRIVPAPPRLAVLAVAIGLIACIIYTIGRNWSNERWWAERARNVQEHIAIACEVNEKNLASGCLEYAADHDDVLPDNRWVDECEEYVWHPELYWCPLVGKRQFGYAMNSALRGARSQSFSDPAKQPAIFDSAALGRNVIGTLALLPDPPRHMGFNNVTFLDLHSERRKGGR